MPGAHKRVVGVSLGSSHRDHRAEWELLGQRVVVERRGSDGDLERARAWIRELDGQVDAIGLGGIDRWVVLDGVRYELRDGADLARQAQRTPVVDGSGIKDTWERWVVEDLHRRGRITPSQPVLMVSALDRFGMAEAFYRLGYSVVAGDLLFVAGIDYPIESRAELVKIGRELLPQYVSRPAAELYPVGDAQRRPPDVRYARYFAEAAVVAGDFHLIRRFWPERLDGKGILTNTTTAEDLKAMQARGVAWVATTTPQLGGRTFGTNLLEAALVAVLGITAEDPAWAERVRTVPLHYEWLWLGETRSDHDA
ncbi:MAG: quinate 5-dehydrogenase [Firmicutes bacterium]|nr:quinate 5-dehydrogenase [Alicyclobacillaceae bacterium]MCL6497148.1 quinate 5-dehydrogenase [Bacillota bacterium]